MKKTRLLGCFILFALLCASFAFPGGETENKNTSGEKIVLTMWDDKSNEDEARVIKKIVEEWNNANPNVIIEREAVDIESYKMKIKTAIAADEAPDLFYSYGAGFSKPFVDAEKVLPLDEYLSDDIKENAISGTWTYGAYGDKTFGLPIFMWCGVLYCNTEMFEENGVEIPETFDDLMEAIGKFRQNGIGPIGVGANERWTAMFYHNVLALQAAGADLCNKALSGNADFDSAEFLKAAQMLEDLTNAKAFNDGCLGLNYDEIVALFKQGMIPMIYQGNWLAGELEMDDCPVKGKVNVVNFPGTGTEYLGGAIEIYMVSNNTKNKEAAVKVLEFVCENYSKYGFEEGLGLPVFEAEYDESSLDRLTVDIVNLVKKATGFVLAWDTFLEGKDAELHLDLVQEMFAGIRTPEDFVKQMQTINEN